MDQVKTGHHGAMSGERPSPSFDSLVEDLDAVRRSGLGRIRSLDLRALHAAAELSEYHDEAGNLPAGIALLLRNASGSLGGGSLQEAAEYLLGLYPGTALWSAAMRRREAAKKFGSSKRAASDSVKVRCSETSSAGP